MTESVVTITTDEDGDKFYRLNGKMHREAGPAFEGANDCKAWCINGKRHREDGPAVEYDGGGKEWWLDGRRYTEENWLKEMEQRTLVRCFRGLTADIPTNKCEIAINLNLETAVVIKAACITVNGVEYAPKEDD